MNHSQNVLVAFKCCLSVDVFWNVVLKINMTKCFITLCVFLKLFWVDLKFTYSSDTSPEDTADESEDTIHPQ